jgi:hypothetical protein
MRGFAGSSRRAVRRGLQCNRRGGFWHAAGQSSSYAPQRNITHAEQRRGRAAEKRVRSAALILCRSPCRVSGSSVTPHSAAVPSQRSRMVCMEFFFEDTCPAIHPSRGGRIAGSRIRKVRGTCSGGSPSGICGGVHILHVSIDSCRRAIARKSNGVHGESSETLSRHPRARNQKTATPDARLFRSVRAPEGRGRARSRIIKTKEPFPALARKGPRSLRPQTPVPGFPQIFQVTPNTGTSGTVASGCTPPWPLPVSEYW